MSLRVGLILSYIAVVLALCTCSFALRLAVPVPMPTLPALVMLICSRDFV